MTTKIVSVDATTSKIQVNDQDVATLSSINGLGINAINGGQLAGMRNRIINGKMEISQRGTSFPALNNYGLDRFIFGASGGGVATVSQQSDSPGDEFKNSLRITVTTADTTIAAADLYALSQRIEGYNISDLRGRPFTLSFWVRSSKLGIHCVSFKNSGLDYTAVFEYNVTAQDTWEKKTITVQGGLINVGTWNFTNGIGLYLHWSLAAGTTYNAPTPVTWNSGNFLTTANQVNCMDTVGNIFAITGVQLEVGTVATPFEHRPYGAELALCQRYYWRADTPTDGNKVIAVGSYRSSSTTAELVGWLPVPMRTNGTLTLSAASTFNLYGTGGAPTLSSTGTFLACSRNTYSFAATATSTPSTQGFGAMLVLGTGAFIEVNAEL